MTDDPEIGIAAGLDVPTALALDEPQRQGGCAGGCCSAVWPFWFCGGYRGDRPLNRHTVGVRLIVYRRVCPIDDTPFCPHLARRAAVEKLRASSGHRDGSLRKAG